MSTHTTTRVLCDICHRECHGNYFKAGFHNKNVEDICLKCGHEMSHLFHLIEIKFTFECHEYSDKKQLGYIGWYKQK